MRRGNKDPHIMFVCELLNLRTFLEKFSEEYGKEYLRVKIAKALYYDIVKQYEKEFFVLALMSKIIEFKNEFCEEMESMGVKP